MCSAKVAHTTTSSYGGLAARSNPTAIDVPLGSWTHDLTPTCWKKNHGPSWPIMARQPRDSNPWQPMSQRALCSAPPCRAYSFPTTDAFASPPVSCCGCNSNLSSPKTLSQLSGFCIFSAQSDFTISAPSAALLRQKP